MLQILRALLVVSSLPACLVICTQAHMQMSWPYPLRSPLDPAVPVDMKDYDNTSPLSNTGSNFPCKHYQTLDNNPQANDIKATYQSGSSYNITLAGTATHMGGSCQISISYDNGASFKVIKSIIGGCPLAGVYDFTIPSFAPSSSTALLSWSWFNLVGNREMYQNCARVQIRGTGSQRYRRTSYKRQTSMDDLPDMFACNIGNGCTTLEQQEVVFPNPGTDVVYGQDEVAPSPGPGFTYTTTPSGNAFSTVAPTAAPSTTAPPFPMSNQTAPGSPYGSGTVTLSTSSSTTQNQVLTTFATTTTSITSPTATAVPGSCTPGTFACNSATTFSQCVVGSSGSTTYTYMGSVASGMQCVDGKFVRANAGPCTPSGAIFCHGSSAFYICDQGGLIDMGPVPAGTSCVNGVIGLA